MRPLALLRLSVVAAAAITHPKIPGHVEVIEREAGREYTVQLECVGCPVRAWTSPHKAKWLHPSPNSSLLLKFDLAEFNDALLLNEHRIFPLGPMPLHINAMQVPTGMEQDETDSEEEDASAPNKPKCSMFPLLYQHSVFRAEEPEYWWLQFNVTGLPWGETPEPIKMGQKVVQILLHKEYNGNLDGEYILSIAEVQVVEAKDKAHPPRMKCGKLAMLQTTFDPSEWDQYGKIGTWSRTWNFLSGRLHLGENVLLLPLLAMLAASLVVARRLFLQRQQEKSGPDSDAETALLGRDAPPPYADIPVIKIEEYD